MLDDFVVTMLTVGFGAIAVYSLVVYLVQPVCRALQIVLSGV